jgi:hypothetical protein
VEFKLYQLALVHKYNIIKQTNTKMAGSIERSFAPVNKEFSKPAQKFLKFFGYEVYNLDLLLSPELKETRDRFNENYPDFRIPAPSSFPNVAINKERPIQVLSGRALEMQEERSRYLSERGEVLKIDGEPVGLSRLTGTVQDYTMLLFAHREKTGESLFSNANGISYIKTSTEYGQGVACLSDFDSKLGPHVTFLPPEYNGREVGTLTLLVPA